VIFEAATDSADQLCSLAGNDIRGLIAAPDLPLRQREERLHGPPLG
jgi:hypothetical protein